MAQTVPTSEPTSVVAGDTIAWRKTLSDYPASAGWVLKYRLINAAGKIDITASASGDDHLVNISSVTSAAYLAGQYTWQSHVEKAGERYTLDAGLITIKPDLAAEAAGFDTRSDARKTLDAVNAAMVAKGASAWTAEYEIAGRRMKFRSPAEFDSMRQRLIAEVAREERAAKIAAGLGSGSKIYVRF